MNLSDGLGKVAAVSRTAKRQWEVGLDEPDRLADSLGAVQAIGEFIGGVVHTQAPTAERASWEFVWEDDSTDEAPLRPEWAVEVGDDEGLDRANAAVELITEFIGGVVQIAAVRQEVAPGVYATTHRAFQWRSYMPALKPVASAEELAEAPESNGVAVAG